MPQTWDSIGPSGTGSRWHGGGRSVVASPSPRKQEVVAIRPPVISRNVGLREWLEGLESAPAPVHVPAAAFDTRIKGPRVLWGSAAHAAEPHLRRAGATLIAPAESFVIGGPRGPKYGALLEG